MVIALPLDYSANIVVRIQYSALQTVLNFCLASYFSDIPVCPRPCCAHVLPPNTVRRRSRFNPGRFAIVSR